MSWSVLAAVEGAVTNHPTSLYVSPRPASGRWAGGEGFFGRESKECRGLTDKAMG
ncbi:MAG: hypothetical protein ACK5O8_14355 [Pirellula sp.]